MCGICGIVQIGGSPREVVAPEVLDRMTDVMTHRGPDDRGVHRAPGIAIGARRLSIVDVADGHQPFSNETGSVWAAQNGEIYNHEELRRGLHRDGHALRTRCDTEVLPHLYERHGVATPEHLRGMFGLVIWDAERRRAVIARDRLGIKPLYHARVGDLLLFATELKSLLASGLIVPELDYEAIDAYLTLGFFPTPRTALSGVSKVMPGCRLVVDERGVREERYWEHPHADPGPRSAGVEHYSERLLAELEESVRLRLMADVPLGAMLSGGLDSSVIVALMAKQMSAPVKTFSVGFAEAGPGNELSDARLVANALGTDHHEVELSFDEQTVDLSELVWFVDEPLADLSALGFLALSELAAQHVTVALSGQGADELLGGYRKHRAASLAGMWHRLPGPARSLGGRLAAHGPARLRKAGRTFAAPDAAARLLITSGNLDPALRRHLVRGPLAETTGDAALRAVRRHLDGVDRGPLADALYLDAHMGLVDDMLHYFDRASMAHSLEVRVPFLDHRLVEYCATIPPAFKVRRLQTKHVLKRAARGLIPDQIIDKPKVGFFNAAVDTWFRQQTSGVIADYLLDPSPRYAEIIDQRVVRRLVADHASGADQRNAYALLAILMLEVWLSSFLPRALGAPVPSRERIRVEA
jgi:asparagine synthase (glutamine-hydrolysing)